MYMYIGGGGAARRLPGGGAGRRGGLGGAARGGRAGRHRSAPAGVCERESVCARVRSFARELVQLGGEGCGTGLRRGRGGCSSNRTLTAGCVCICCSRTVVIIKVTANTRPAKNNKVIRKCFFHHGQVYQPAGDDSDRYARYNEDPNNGPKEISIYCPEAR